MNIKDAKDCLGGPAVVQEQFIPDHLFLYVTRGAISCYDGRKSDTYRQGDYGLVRKNRLAKYHNDRESGFERIFFCFDEPFLRTFQQKYKLQPVKFESPDTFIRLKPAAIITDFIASLKPYMDNSGKISTAFEDLKYEELLLILLQEHPGLAGLFFDYASPQKINLEEFMQRNFRFNVRLERFAYLTGRSLSAFKRDFKAVFHAAPGRWLMRKRLEEAYALIENEGKKASEIYLDLGFEDLSHFSSAFKNLFGLRPTALAAQKMNRADYKKKRAK